MMVAEYAERQSRSPINGETLSNNENSPTNNISSNMLSSPGNNFYITEQLGVRRDLTISRDGKISPRSRSPSSDSFPGVYDSHVTRKDLFSQRKQREFIPDNKKDESYWDRRRRNNEAAKRSREKRRYNDMILEQRVVELSKENHFLKAQLAAIKDKCGINGESIVNVEQVMATLPSNDQILSTTKRVKSSCGNLVYPVPTPVIHRPSQPSSVHSNFQDNDSYQNNERFTPFPFPPVLPPLNPPVLEAESVLNLSRPRVESPISYEEVSVDSHIADTTHFSHPSNNNNNNNLPHKLRHKSHLGDAAAALLSLHSIKQEPRGSPPWGDGEGSSDERDSGISIGTDWIVGNSVPPTSPLQQIPSNSPIHRNSTSPISGIPVASPSSPSLVVVHQPPETEDEDSHLKSEVARLASEVASLKSMLSRKNASSVIID